MRGTAAPQADELACDAADRRACHRAGLASLTADGGEGQLAHAWERLERACALGEAAACDDGAAYAKSRDNLEGQRWFEEFGRLARKPIAAPEEWTGFNTPADAGIADVIDAGSLRHQGFRDAVRALVAQTIAPLTAPVPRRELHQKCLTDAEYERYRVVKAALEDPHAFRPSALWAPPIYMTDAERSYAWVALLYFQTLDFEGGTRTRILAPLFISHCAPESDTFISPLYFHRIDAEGSARLFFTYFQRRDRLAETDLFFPLAWSVRERKTEASPWVGSGAVLPFVFWQRGLTGAHFTVVAPLFWRFGDDTQTTTIAANVFLHESPTRSELGIVPLYFRGRGEGGDSDVSPLFFWSYRDGPKHSLLLPLLLTWHQGDGVTESTWVLNTYFQSRPTGFTLNVVPLLFAGREGDAFHLYVPPLFWRWSKGLENTTVLPLLFTVHRGAGDTESTWVLNAYFQSRRDGFTFNIFPLLFAGRDGVDHHTFVPPVFWRWGDAVRTTTIIGTAFLSEGTTRTDFGFAPLYFGGRSLEGDYDVSPLFFWALRDAKKHSTLIPALLTFHTGDGVTESTWVINTFFQSRPTGFTLASIPLLFAGREGTSSYSFVPPLFWHWGDGKQATTIAVNVFLSESDTRSDFGIVPFYFRGRSAEGEYDVSPPLFWSFRDGKTHSLFIPPLLTYHSGDGVTESTWAFNTWFQSRPGGFTLASVPFLFAGRDRLSHYTLLPPLVWHWGDAKQETTIAANVFLSESETRNDFGVVPLYFRGRSAEAEYDISPPLFWSFRDGKTHSLFLPLLFT